MEISEIRRSSKWGFLAGGGRETGGGSSSNRAKERADVGGGDGHSGDRLDFSPGDRSPRGDFTGRTVPRSSGFGFWRVPYWSTGNFKSTE
jgi:hypothetical protein